MPRAKAADPGWTSWRGHDIVGYPIELYTCPRVLGVRVLRVLWVCRWQGKYGCALSEESVADQKRYGEEVNGGGEREVVAVELVIVTQTRRVFESVCPTVPSSRPAHCSSPTMGSVNLLILLACIGILHGT